MDSKEAFQKCVREADFAVVITLNGDAFNLFSNLPTADKTVDFVLQAIEAFLLDTNQQQKYDSVESYAKRMTEEILHKVSKKDIDKDLH